MTQNGKNQSSIDRRGFLKGGSAALAAAALARPSFAYGPVSHADEIRVGLIGCGGRGTGAAANALQAEPRAKLVAVCDLFADQLESSLAALKGGPFADRVTVEADRKFTGFDGYKSLIDCVDVVLLCTSPHYRPLHLEAAVSAGKHVFCEKPVAVDAPGLRQVMETCAKAREKRLNVVSGLCYRYQDEKIETLKRIHDGAVGEIVALQCTYNASGLWHRGRNSEWSEMEQQNRNWLYYSWLSGDHIAEQSIHSLDKILWAMKDEAPMKVTASGGRSVRTDPMYGNVYDHFNTVFEWQNGVRLFHSCRQWQDADTDVSDFVYGRKGVAAIQHHRIRGENSWQWKGPGSDMYVREHEALFKAIREDQPINNGDYMCKSTLMAIMGRMSAYTGKTLTWEQALASKQVLGPREYAWGEVSVDAVARPGETPFV